MNHEVHISLPCDSSQINGFRHWALVTTNTKKEKQIDIM